MRKEIPAARKAFGIASSFVFSSFTIAWWALLGLSTPAFAEEVTIVLLAPPEVNVDIFLDNSLLKKTVSVAKSNTINVEPGKHVIELRRTGLFTEKREIIVRKGEAQKLEFSLRVKSDIFSEDTVAEKKAPEADKIKTLTSLIKKEPERIKAGEASVVEEQEKHLLDKPDFSRWSINSEALFGPNVSENVRHSLDILLSKLGEQATTIEKKLSREEFISLCDDPRAENVYLDELLKIASPESKKKQSAQHKSWVDHFLKRDKVEAGKNFLREHAELLERAKQLYGVEPEDIVSILMWESLLGKITGKYRIFNTYISQIAYVREAEKFSEGYKPGNKANSQRLDKLINRASDNLSSFLRLCKAKGQDPLDITGSWAGAIGFAQFMPKSFQFAVDGDGDGAIDLFAFPDSVVSIANYLVQNGYKTDRKKSIYAYNPEKEYVRGVELYADAITR